MSRAPQVVLLNLNYVVSVLINLLAGGLALVSLSWGLVKSVQFSMSITAVASILLVLLPKLLDRDGWAGYVKAWHACRLLVACFIYLLLYPFILWLRWGKRLTPIWALLSVVAICGATQVVDLRRDRPLVEQALAEMAIFLNEQPRIDAPVGQKVKSLLARYDPVRSSATELYQDLPIFIQAVERIYQDGLPNPPLVSKVASQLESRLANKSGRTDLGSALTELLLVRMYIYLYQTQADPISSMQYLYKALLLVEGLEKRSWPRNPQSSLGQAYIALDELRTNSIAALDLFCAQHHDEYEEWSRRHKREVVPLNELLDDAERRWEAIGQSKESSTLGRIRAVNNHAALVMQRIRTEIEPSTDPVRPATWNDSSALIRSEERLARHRQELANVLREGTPHSNVMATLAEIDLLLAHVNALIYENQVGRKKLPKERLDRIKMYLRRSTEDINMALQCGFDSSQFIKNSHELNLCRLLSFNLVTRQYSPEVNRVFHDAQEEALRMLKRNGITPSSCPICLKFHEIDDPTVNPAQT